MAPSAMICPDCQRSERTFTLPQSYADFEQAAIHVDCWNRKWFVPWWKPLSPDVERGSVSGRSAFFRQIGALLESRAFRRLGYKSQVLTNHEGDLHRTRLTHTLHVAYLAETIAGILNLDVDLARVIALAHDIGHAPFGHAGEKAIQDWLGRRHSLTTLPKSNEDPGYRQLGFSHNYQSVRVATDLESHYRDGPGMKLSNVVLDGVLRHTGRYLACGPGAWAHLGRYNALGRPDSIGIHDGDARNPGLTPAVSLEGQVVHWADDIAQLFHDLEDALIYGVIQPAEFVDHPFWKDEVRGFLERHQPKIANDDYAAITRDLRAAGGRPCAPDLLTRATSLIQKYLVRTLLLTTFASIWSWVEARRGRAAGPEWPVVWVDGEARALCDYDPAMRQTIKGFKKHFLADRLYGGNADPRIVAMNERAMRIVREILEAVAEEPKLIPPPGRPVVDATGKLPEDVLELASVDYVAALTDREAMQVHRNIYGDAQDRIFVPIG
jgi:dGTPase